MNNSADNGLLSLSGSILLGIYSWFTPDNVDMGLKAITAIGAFVSAILAARYYWYATKEKKESLRKLREKNDEAQ